jgi:hypothetical protein
MAKAKEPERCSTCNHVKWQHIGWEWSGGTSAGRPSSRPASIQRCIGGLDHCTCKHFKRKPKPKPVRVKG